MTDEDHEKKKKICRRTKTKRDGRKKQKRREGRRKIAAKYKELRELKKRKN